VSELPKAEAVESEVLQRARRGDEDAFKAIIERHEHQVAATVIGILGRDPEVEDIGQETFVQFFKSMDRFRGDSQLGTYLTRIAINLSLNELKRRKRSARMFEPESRKDGDVVQHLKDRESASDIQGLVRRGLGQLPPEFRTVVVLRLIDGYSTRETADILRLPQGTVLSRLARGQAKLKEIVDGMMNER